VRISIKPSLAARLSLRRMSTGECGRLACHSPPPDLWPATPDMVEQGCLLCPPILEGWPAPGAGSEPGPAQAFCSAWLDVGPLGPGDKNFCVAIRITVNSSGC